MKKARQYNFLRVFYSSPRRLTRFTKCDTSSVAPLLTSTCGVCTRLLAYDPHCIGRGRLVRGGPCPSSQCLFLHLDQQTDGHLDDLVRHLLQRRSPACPSSGTHTHSVPVHSFKRLPYKHFFVAASIFVQSRLLKKPKTFISHKRWDRVEPSFKSRKKK